jgi:hypothetical protein
MELMSRWYERRRTAVVVETDGPRTQPSPSRSR